MSKRKQGEYNGEDDVKDAIKKLLQKYGWWYFMPPASQFGSGGIPDFICCKDGRFLGIEAKFGNNKPTDRQHGKLEDIRRHGGIGIWVNETRLPLLEALLRKLG